ncbi:hypothetical protein BGW37DRAFT_93495 [Umbelopsis sp. PMI_123]|jgi:uncharacterized protein YbjT (DUF2867 family)|nr:hypothetical protein BGW37DRAFT_93495 [Umbelopsis sp. PMI_123]
MSKVYVIGATGGIGNQLVKFLLERGVQTTALVRDPSKAAGLFGESQNLNVVQGDHSNVEAFKNSIEGHDRLFILITDFNDMAPIKVNYAKIAYAAGVKQIVDLSSGSAGGPWRQNQIAAIHYASEHGIFNLPNRGAYVALRPTGFFTNHYFGDHQTIKFQSTIYGSADPDTKRPYISTKDIAELAANIFTEPVEKNGDMVYEMTSQMLSGNDRAQLLSKVLEKDIKYVQIPAEQEYKNYSEFAHMPHAVAYGLVDNGFSGYAINPGLSIVLHRAPQTLEEWYQENKEKL